ncbi:hypothetical protein BH11BAC7_BH11BAC7_15210 [soil metagenome]
MKKIFIISLALLGSLSMSATHQSFCSMLPVSSETGNISGSLSFQLKYLINEPVTFGSQPSFILPDRSWSISTTNSSSRFGNISYLPGDTFSVWVNFNYNAASLPFYAQTIQIIQQDASARSSRAEVKIYFTPYNTVEIWSVPDFCNLKRTWMAPSGIAMQRQYVHPDSIPQSNIPQGYTITQPWQENTREAYVPGLAYTIPMLA